MSQTIISRASLARDSARRPHVSPLFLFILSRPKVQVDTDEFCRPLPVTSCIKNKNEKCAGKLKRRSIAAAGRAVYLGGLDAGFTPRVYSRESTLSVINYPSAAEAWLCAGPSTPLTGACRMLPGKSRGAGTGATFGKLILAKIVRIVATRIPDVIR